MKPVYTADHAAEAYMILHMLEHHGIQGHIFGEHLQGAIGGIPTGGVVQVMVIEEDVEEAQRLIEESLKIQTQEPE